MQKKRVVDSKNKTTLKVSLGEAEEKINIQLDKFYKIKLVEINNADELNTQENSFVRWIKFTRDLLPAFYVN